MKLRDLFGPSAETLWERGGEAMQANRDSEALALFESAVGKEPRNGKYLNDAGRASIKLKQWAKARAYFERVREIAPDDPWSLFGLGNCSAGEKKFDDAVRIYDQVLGMEMPMPQLTWFCMASSFPDLGRFEDALLALDKCQEIDPGFAMAVPMRIRIVAAMQ